MFKNLVGLLFVFVVPLAVQMLIGGAPSFWNATSTSTDPTSLTTLQIVVAAAAMLIGIVFGAAHENLKRAKAGTPVLASVKATLSQPGLYKALFAAPIVFGGVYTATLHTLDPVIAFIFAFQNGFFCESLLRPSTTGR